MAGTDHRRDAWTGGPAIILVGAQLGENIGTAARAMLNFGLDDLRLVAPRDGWPSDHAVRAASGADAVIEAVRVYDTTAAAVADLRHVYAATARDRDMVKPVVTPRRAAEEMRVFADRDEAVGVLFGPERSGLDNDDVTIAGKIIAVPANPAFASLNLAQAVLLLGYEWRMAAADVAPRTMPYGATRPATREEQLGFFTYLERELDQCGFLWPPEKRPSMVRNIRNMFDRADLTEQEIRSLYGIVAGLVGGPRRGAKRREV